MWLIDNKTSYAAERTWLRDQEGAHLWAIAVKAVFDLGLDGSVKLADLQPPPLLLPEYLGDPSQSSLRLDAELGPVKPTTDVIVIGQAWAPNAKPADRVPVGLRIGPISKQLIVFGSRVYYRGVLGISLSAPARFTNRPLVYEWAFGGADRSDPDLRRHRVDRRNPAGKGFGLRAEHLMDQPAHCIEYPQGDAAKLGPAGFGAIAPHWSPRADHAGTFDERWRRTRFPLLPEDYDPRFVLSAPPDQRPARHLTGGEPVELVNLTPAGLLRFVLPKIWLTFTTCIGSKRTEHRSKLVTVAIEPDSMRLSLVWATTLMVGPREVDHLDRTVIREKAFLT